MIRRTTRRIFGDRRPIHTCKRVISLREFGEILDREYVEPMRAQLNAEVNTYRSLMDAGWAEEDGPA